MAVSLLLTVDATPIIIDAAKDFLGALGDNRIEKELRKNTQPRLEKSLGFRKRNA